MDVDVALKRLFLLQTDAASRERLGVALSPRERQFQMASFQRECNVMRSLSHPNILPFVCVVLDERDQPEYLATQFVESGTLSDLIYSDRYLSMRPDGYLPLEVQLVAFIGIFAGLEYLAGKSLIHRDIKPSNVLVVVEGTAESGMQLIKCLLADFGESKLLPSSSSRVAGTVAGTLNYMAPELHEKVDYEP